ncbi:MAG: SagB/ThcOx family dehydrogenase [Thermodesulfobacteriota bacterium]
MEKMMVVVGLVLACGLLPALPAHAGGLKLPAPRLKGPVSVEEALQARRTQRSFTADSLTLEELAQLLWSAYGVTERRGRPRLKTVPSAGALYPLDIYAAVGGVTGLKAGVYHYLPPEHALEQTAERDRRPAVGRAALGQMWLAEAPAVLVITGQYDRTTGKYGPRGRGYVLIESGCSAQSLFLQAEALGLKAGIIGAFLDADVAQALELPPEHEPLLIMPVGRPR